ncbi:MAG TPA: FecR domain-containing protein, partial [Gammaproteobacteria bacterium]
MNRRNALLTVLLVGWLAFWPLAGLAAEAGKVIAVRGSVTASTPDGQLRELKRGDDVFAGETIATGGASFVRLKFTDGGAMYLRAGSRFVIEDYTFEEKEKPNKSNFNLLRGGFRAVTGAIGREDQRAYAVRTPVSTIGIRGTDYQVRLCLGDCLDLASQGLPVPNDGLYTATYEGATVIDGVQIGPNQFSFTAPGGQTFLLNIAPDVLKIEILPEPDPPEQEGGVEGEFDIPAQQRTVVLECPL